MTTREVRDLTARDTLAETDIFVTLPQTGDPEKTTVPAVRAAMIYLSQSSNGELFLRDTGGSVTWGKLSADYIADGAVGGDAIADDGVTAGKLASGSVALSRLASSLQAQIPPTPSGVTDGMVLGVQSDSWAFVAASSAGEKGDAGEDAVIEIIYKRGDTLTPPPPPSGDNNPTWVSTALVPNPNQRYVWRAVRSGTAGSLPSTWIVTLASYLPQDGAAGEAGDDGAAGASAVARYRRTASSTAPSPPTSNSDAAWNETYTAPDATNDFAWMAFRVGTGAWQVILVSQHQASSGGSTPPPAQDHAIYLAYGATQDQTTFTGADFTSSRAVNNSNDETVNTLTPAALTPANAYRHYAVAIPADRRLSELYIGTNPINQRGSVNPQPTTGDPNPAGNAVTIPPSTASTYYVSRRPVNNTGEAWRVVTVSA